MNTLEEIIYYCREPEPVGALLLTGEWGCGKTYLIENNLEDALENKAYVLRISLFGISSLEGMHEAVKEKWMEAYYKNKGISSIAEKVEKGKEIFAKLDVMPDFIKGIASTNWTSLIEIKEKIDNKPVILVFDDLERCCMNNVDVLGAINAYCENQKFHTIIVANQDKMHTTPEEITINAEIEFNNAQQNRRDNREKEEVVLKMQIPTKEEPGEISYTEIKEKIIQRTVEYIPDYLAIVHAVIENMKYQEREAEEKGYKAFVKKCESELLELFAPDRWNTANTNSDDSENIFEQVSNVKDGNTSENQKHPHNIRSLKCAISDFYRVYEILRENGFENIDRWFYSFTAYMISYKADIAKEDHYGTIFSDEEVRKLYPVFQNQYMLRAVKKWILHGVWDEQEISHEIQIIKEREKAETSADIVRTYRIIDVDEEIINEGLKDVLDMAYAGRLILDEYVLLIENSCWSRRYHFALPETIDWCRVRKGIEICIENLIEAQPEGQQLHSIIGSENREYFTEEEWNTYQVIDDFKNGNVMMFNKNRKMYIEGMKESAIASFSISQNKRFNVFDEEMATATAEAYAKGHNADKHQFTGCFKEMWRKNIISQDIDVNESLVGFRTLLSLLKGQQKILQEANKTFAVMHTDTFIQIVEEMISQLVQREKEDTDE